MINKKTILDDNASIYKKHSDRPKKESLKKMSKEEKWQYFKDYYLKSDCFYSNYYWYWLFFEYNGI